MVILFEIQSTDIVSSSMLKVLIDSPAGRIGFEVVDLGDPLLRNRQQLAGTRQGKLVVGIAPRQIQPRPRACRLFQIVKRSLQQ